MSSLWEKHSYISKADDYVNVCDCLLEICVVYTFQQWLYLFNSRIQEALILGCTQQND